MNLHEWLEKTEMKYCVFAKRVNINRTTLYLWLKKKTVPTYQNYLKIKEVTNGEVTYEEILEAQISCKTN